MPKMHAQGGPANLPVLGTTSQRALSAARAAVAAGVGPRLVAAAVAVLETEDETLIDAVERGAVRISAAADLASLPPDARVRIVAKVFAKPTGSAEHKRLSEVAQERVDDEERIVGLRRDVLRVRHPPVVERLDDGIERSDEFDEVSSVTGDARSEVLEHRHGDSVVSPGGLGAAVAGWLAVDDALDASHAADASSCPAVRDVTDEEIRALRAESRAVGDIETSRACSAALGLPTGDGALGLLDRNAARARVSARIRGVYLPLHQVPARHDALDASRALVEHLLESMKRAPEMVLQLPYGSVSRELLVNAIVELWPQRKRSDIGEELAAIDGKHFPRTHRRRV